MVIVSRSRVDFRSMTNLVNRESVLGIKGSVEDMGHFSNFARLARGPAKKRSDLSQVQLLPMPRPAI